MAWSTAPSRRELVVVPVHVGEDFQGADLAEHVIAALVGRVGGLSFRDRDAGELGLGETTAVLQPLVGIGGQQRDRRGVYGVRRLAFAVP